MVNQRLRLASVSPALLEVYADEGMSLEQLMAFAVTDHGRQEQVWQTISGSWQKEPYQIRRMLTEKSARASDRRAMFVGLDAYEAARGVVLRNPFQSDDATTAAGSRTSLCSTVWSLRSERQRRKRSPPKAGSGSSSQGAKLIGQYDSSALCRWVASDRSPGPAQQHALSTTYLAAEKSMG